ncbi:MAG: metallophosphoesterase [Planctomycetota bacterium]
MKQSPLHVRYRRRDLLARAGLLTAAVPLVGAIDGFLITPHRLVTSVHRFGNAASKANANLRLLQISDLHLRRMGGLEQRLLEQLHECQPDVLVFTGDIVDTPAALWQLEIFLRECPRQPRTFAIVGNWEHHSGISLEALHRLYDQHGIELLINRSVELEKNGVPVRVTGLDDFVGGHPNAKAALRDATPTKHHLVLAHCPAARDALQLPGEHPASLVLSGHTHGGQVAPLGIAIVRPRGSGRYVAGWYEGDGPPLYVSRGIGTSLLPVRIGATPELVHIDWSLGSTEATAVG